jgi:L,D-transpeptidase-like protein/putative peptidoglycan binding protein
VRRALLVLALLLAGPGTASAATQVTFGVHPGTPLYNRTARFSGVVTVNGSPAGGQHVDLIANTGSGWAILAGTNTQANGSYSFTGRVTAPGSYAAQAAGATSPAINLHLRPRLAGRVRGLPYPGSALFLAGRLAPATGGRLTLHVGTRSWPVRVRANGRFRARLPTRRPGWFRARIVVTPNAGFASTVLRRGFTIRTPYLAIGSSGRAVLALERRLRALRHPLRNVNTFFGVDTYEAVLAFQKVHWIRRTGHVSDATWRKLGVAHIPRARIARGNHIEVDKTRQVLFEVRSGKVVRVIHVSTGATGNTPIGHWHVYLKTAGLNSHGMYYSMYWLRGFAVHGYASVPPWPASHGCVRIPMWLAPGLYSRWTVGTSVYVYYS